jgi:DNA-binding CsgD family transcriptional regulator/tetratricopeptide (TPR) repeat protein
MPLALELAAARLPVLTVEQVTARLDDRLRLLTGGPTLPARQRSLRATLDWSHDRLPAPERALFRRLSAFAGGCTLAAIDAVCNADGDLSPTALDEVAALVHHSLLQRQADDDEPRFGLLETVRAYAAEHLAGSGEAAALRDRHAAYHLALAEAEDQDLPDPGEARRLDALEREHDNLRAALAWLLARGEVERGLRLGAALGRFWWSRGHQAEGRRWLTRVLEQAETAPAASAPLPRLRAYQAAARLAYYQDDYAAARALIERLLALARDHDRRFIAHGLALRGEVAFAEGDLAAARTAFGESLVLQRALGDRRGIAFALGGLGSAALATGDYLAAHRQLGECVRLFEADGDRLDTIIYCARLGLAARAQGDDRAAEAWFATALARSRESDSPTVQVEILAYLGVAAIRRGDLAGARALLDEALTQAERERVPLHLVFCLEGYAALAVAIGLPGSALHLAGAATALRAATGAPRHVDEVSWLEGMLAPARSALGRRAGVAAEAAGEALTPVAATAEARALTLPATTEPPVSPPDHLAVERPPARPAGLSAREVEVLQLLADGATDVAIADQLSISVRTVNGHVTSILGKTGSENRAAAAVWASRHGLV